MQSIHSQLKYFGDMGYDSEVKTSSRQQQTSKGAKDNILSSREFYSHSLEKRKKGYSFGTSYIERHCELRPSTGDDFTRLRSSTRNQSKIPGCNKSQDEIVKHMSNLPGFLQRVGRLEDLQGKALNFGVLDWERLEKWKRNERFAPARGFEKISSWGSNSSYFDSQSVTVSGASFVKNIDPRKKQHPPLTLSSPREGVPQVVQAATGRIISRQDPFKQATLNGPTRALKKDDNSWRKCSQTQKGNKSVGKTTMEKESSTYEGKNIAFLFPSEDTKNFQVVETLEEGSNPVHKSSVINHQNAVIPTSKHSSQKSCPVNCHLLKPRTTSDGKKQGSRKPFSNCPSSKEFDSDDHLYGAQTCALPAGVATTTARDLEPCQFVNAECKNVYPSGSQSYASSNHIRNASSGYRCPEDESSDAESASSTTTTTSKVVDRDIMEAVRGTHPSPSRRFSFSLSRMSRSFSFKEGKESSSVPQLKSLYTSVKSGPLRCASSVSFDSPCKEKSPTTNRARSSPLRRILEPFLRTKGTHFTRFVQPSTNSSSVCHHKPTTSGELIWDEKLEAPIVRAYLHLTMKNGLPLFKLLVDNRSDILVAGLKKLPNTGDPSLLFAFCVVRENKKKSGGQKIEGSKPKFQSIDYNVVGHLKVSSSCIQDFGVEKSKEQFLITESVLYDVDVMQADKDVPELMPDRELAAIIVKSSNETLNIVTETRNNHQYTEKYDMRGQGSPSSTTIILPGGVHGRPSEGTPSPLISRWKSGGLCDCGGWDLGCKLSVLTDCGQLNVNSTQGRPGHYDLFVQNAGQVNKPVFSLATSKNGIFSVEFKAPVSSIHALSICVALLSGSNSFGFSDTSEEKLDIGSDRMKPGITIQSEALRKYAPSPPPSPVGRV